MMKPYRTTILLALVCGGLGAYLYWIDMPTARQEVKQQIAEQRLLSFDYREITTFAINTSTVSVTLAKDEDDRWHIQQPVSTPADSREVGNMLRALDLGKVTRRIDTLDHGLKEYGLAAPHMTLLLKAGDRTERLSLGDIAPVSSTLYGKRHSDGQVLLTTLDVKDFRKKSLLTFRKKEILSFNRAHVDQFTIRFGQEEFVLSQTAATHGFTGDWQFQAPMKGPADKTAIGLLLMTLEDLTATAFIDPGPERNRLAKELAVPTVAITLHAGPKMHQMKLFQLGRPGKAYAIRSPQDPIYRINPDVLKQLPQTPFDLQDRRLLGMKAKEIVLLSVKTPKTSYVLIHQHGEWVMEDHPMTPLDAQAIKLFVSRVADLPAERRVTEKEGKNIARLGLASPSVEITATDKRGRERGRLLIGNREKGLIYVKGAGLPGIYQARSLILTQIPSQEALLLQ